jgi:hypothetical protein
MYYELSENVNSRVVGAGNRRLLRIIRVDDEAKSNIQELINDIKSVLKTKENRKDLINPITGVTIFGRVFEEPEKFLPLIKALKRARINIWVYTPIRMDFILKEIRNGKTDYMEILKCVPVIVDGYDGGGISYYKRDDGLKFRYKIWERVIDVKKTIHKQDGKIYLLSYAYLQESEQNKFNFYFWLRSRIKTGNNETDDNSVLNIIRVLYKFDRDMVMINDIEDMLSHLRKLNVDIKNINKLKYLHNRWCTRIELYELEDRINSIVLHFRDRERFKLMTVGQILDEYKAMKKTKQNDKRSRKPNRDNNRPNNNRVNERTNRNRNVNHNKYNNRDYNSRGRSFK